MSLKSWLAHPLTKGLDVDHPLTTLLRNKIIQDNAFLQQIYTAWYRLILKNLPEGDGVIVELGSGAGFLKDIAPVNLITSEVFHCPTVQVVLDGQFLPFENETLGAVVMTDVLHHIPHTRLFFSEAIRCLKPDGVIVMIEPWVSHWSKFIYTNFHHEPFLPDTDSWDFPSSGPLSGANGALPWIIFRRDREQFVREFKQLEIQSILPMMPFCYLVSGGVSMRGLMPGWTFSLWRMFERLFEPWMDHWAMFALVVVKKTKLLPAHPNPKTP